MISAWTKNLKTEPERQDFTDYLRGSTRLLNRLEDLIVEEQQNLDRLEVSVKAFESPSWAYQQAYYNGFKACLIMFLKLVKILDPQETK